MQKVLLDYNYYMMPEVIVSSSSKIGFTNWERILLALYAVVALFLVCRIVAAIARLIRLKIKSQKCNLGSMIFIETCENDAPFSFFNWIFWNNRIDSFSEQGQQIMKHEIYHVSQKHSFDVVFMEIICALGWLNPFYHLIKKELKAIHEFLADNYAAGRDQKLEYAEILVLQAISSCKKQLVNPFFDNQLKRRINMLTTNKKTTCQYLRKILVLPLLGVVSILFVISCKSKDANPHPSENESVKITDITIADTNSNEPVQIYPTDSDKVPDVTPNNPNKPEIYSKVEIDAGFPGGPAKWREFLQRNLRGEVPVDNGAPTGNYTVIVIFVVDKNGNVSDLKPLTKLGYGMEEEAMRVISRSGKWKPAMNNGKEVTAYRKQPITFQIVEQ